jgi:hypothetical protein
MAAGMAENRIINIYIIYLNPKTKRVGRVIPDRHVVEHLV